MKQMGLLISIIGVMILSMIGAFVGMVVGAIILPMRVLDGRLDFSDVKSILSTDPTNTDHI